MRKQFLTKMFLSGGTNYRTLINPCSDNIMLKRGRRITFCQNMWLPVDGGFWAGSRFGALVWVVLLWNIQSTRGRPFWKDQGISRGRRRSVGQTCICLNNLATSKNSKTAPLKRWVVIAQKHIQKQKICNNSLSNCSCSLNTAYNLLLLLSTIVIAYAARFGRLSAGYYFF
jgi:hypothetical protein